MGIILFMMQIRQASFQEVGTMNKVPWLVGAGVGIEAKESGVRAGTCLVTPGRLLIVPFLEF